MNYELSLLEEWAADPGIIVQPDPDAYQEEIARIRQAFKVMALSHKKEIYIRRYFRVHHDSLVLMVSNLRGQSRSRGVNSKGAKRLLVIAEELLDHLKQQFGRYLGPAAGKGIDPEDPDIDAQKVITTLTLAELGVIIRLFIETGVFKVRNRKALTRFMSKNVVIRTKQVPEQFSEEHLYNAIHTPSEPAMDRLQVALNQMLVELNKLRRQQRKKK
jgi:hypothetical protein